MKRSICKNFADFFVKKSSIYRMNTPSHKLLISNIDVKFAENLKFYELRTHGYLNKTFLILIQKILKNSNISSQSNKNKRFIDRTNQSDYCIMSN